MGLHTLRALSKTAILEHVRFERLQTAINMAYKELLDGQPEMALITLRAVATVVRTIESVSEHDTPQDEW